MMMMMMMMMLIYCTSCVQQTDKYMAVFKMAAGNLDKKTPIISWIEMGEFHHFFGDHITHDGSMVLVY